MARSSSPGRTGARHARPRGMARLRRRFRAYRAIGFLSTHIPGASETGEQCLLLVHGRRVVGEVRYRLCAPCAHGVITALTVDEALSGTGQRARALAHLRARHPGTAWLTHPDTAPEGDILHRMRIRPHTAPPPCPHTAAAA
jgi:hypothetical protein